MILIFHIWVNRAEDIKYGLQFKTGVGETVFVVEMAFEIHMDSSNGNEFKFQMRSSLPTSVG